MENY
jgi:hypothetical protein